MGNKLVYVSFGVGVTIGLVVLFVCAILICKKRRQTAKTKLSTIVPAVNTGFRVEMEDTIPTTESQLNSQVHTLWTTTLIITHWRKSTDNWEAGHIYVLMKHHEFLFSQCEHRFSYKRFNVNAFRATLPWKNESTAIKELNFATMAVLKSI